MSGGAIHGLIVDALPDELHFGEGETPTSAKVQAMLGAMHEAGYSMRGMGIEAELSSMGIWFAQQYVELVAQAEHHAAQQGDLVARERQVRHITLDASYAAAIDRLGKTSPEVQRVAMEVLGIATLLRGPLRELASNIHELRAGRWQGDVGTACPPSLTRCLRTLADAGDVLEAEVLASAASQRQGDGADGGEG